MNKSFLAAFFKSLDHFMVFFLFVFITFEPILDGFFEDLGKSRNSRWPPKMVALSEMITQLLRHVTLSPHDADVKEDINRIGKLNLIGSE